MKEDIQSREKSQRESRKKNVKKQEESNEKGETRLQRKGTYKKNKPMKIISLNVDWKKKKEKKNQSETWITCAM